MFSQLLCCYSTLSPSQVGEEPWKQRLYSKERREEGRRRLVVAVCLLDKQSADGEAAGKRLISALRSGRFPLYSSSTFSFTSLCIHDCDCALWARCVPTTNQQKSQNNFLLRGSSREPNVEKRDGRRSTTKPCQTCAIHRIFLRCCALLIAVHNWVQLRNTIQRHRLALAYGSISYWLNGKKK